MLPVPYSASCPRQHCETLVRIMVIRANRKVDLRCRHTGAQPRNRAICASAYCRHAKSSKALPDKAATVDRLGMTYIHIRVEFQNPTEQDFLQFCAVIEQLKDVPIHVHASPTFGSRRSSTAFAATYRHGRGPGARRNGSSLAAERGLGRVCEAVWQKDLTQWQSKSTEWRT